MKCPNCNKSLWLVRNYCPFCKSNITAPARPRAVTVLCGFFIALGGLIYLSLLLGSGVQADFVAPESRGIYQNIILYALPGLYLVLGGCSLLGHNWARWVLAVWLGANAVATVVIGADLKTLIGSALAFIAVAYYLFRPQARPFFEGKGTIATSSGESAGR